MATMVCFHAHPDDEAIATGGTMARAAAAGHDVVLVVATRGELGEPQPGVLRPGEILAQRREAEARAAAEILGAKRIEFLGYEDSGMMGEPTNDNPSCFWRADVDEAADRLAVVLSDVGADVVTVYDDHGGYGHPDHIQVHRVGHLAAQRVGVGRVFESTMNRTRIAAMIRERLDDVAESGGSDEEVPRFDRDQTFGSPEQLITHAIDVSGFVGDKRRAMEAHRSQIGPDSYFLSMDEATFAMAFGTEWFIASGSIRHEGEPFGTDLFGTDPSKTGMS